MILSLSTSLASFPPSSSTSSQNIFHTRVFSQLSNYAAPSSKQPIAWLPTWNVDKKHIPVLIKSLRNCLLYLLVPSGKESTCKAGDPGSIPGLGWSPGEGIGYPLQYSWTLLVAQMVKNPPAMQETWVQSLGWKDHLKEGLATHSSVLPWRTFMDRDAWWVTVRGVTKSRTGLSD